MEVEVSPHPARVVVAALPLKPAARERLAAALGPGHVVVDIREADQHRADVVVAPPCSPQAIGRLQATFPGARVVVAEVEDDLFDVHLPGPVRRSLDAGAARYLVAGSIDQLGALVRAGVAPEAEGADAERAPAALPEGGVDELVIRLAREAAERRAR